MNTIPPHVDGKLRQFKRLVLSYADFKHAKLAATYILDENLHQKYPQESYVLLEALNCSMILAYCRPFSGNDAGIPAKVPDLPTRILRVLNAEEREVHSAVMADRNKVLAHSDSDALNLDPVIWQVSGHDIVVPYKNWGLAPLNHQATTVFRSAADKLLRASIEERMLLEPDIKPYFRVEAIERAE